MRFLRGRYDAPAQGRVLLDLEPRPEHADSAVIHFDHCLEIIHLEDPIPGATTKLQRDIGLQTSKQKGHHGSW